MNTWIPLLRLLPKPLKYLLKLSYSIVRIRPHDVRLLTQMQSLVLDGVTSKAKEGMQFCWFTCQRDFLPLQMSIRSLLSIPGIRVGGLWIFMDPKSPLTEAQSESLSAIGDFVNILTLPYPNTGGWGIQSILGYWSGFKSIAHLYPRSWICKLDSDMLITSNLVFQHAFQTNAQVIRQRSGWYLREIEDTDSVGAYLFRSSAVLEMTQSSAVMQMLRAICRSPGFSIRNYPEDRFFGGWFQSNRLRIEDIVFQLPCKENRDGQRLTWEEIESRVTPSIYLPSLIHFDGPHKDLMPEYFHKADMKVPSAWVNAVGHR